MLLRFNVVSFGIFLRVFKLSLVLQREQRCCGAGAPHALVFLVFSYFVVVGVDEVAQPINGFFTHEGMF